MFSSHNHEVFKPGSRNPTVGHKECNGKYTNVFLGLQMLTNVTYVLKCSMQINYPNLNKKIMFL